ncbi:MAG: CDF family Co(II)/Ni(II) efflux transporter DmeF [Bdellovibrionales bacterium]|nr:CDF family Co(II)/Ni(II) efflux transporter DmeF [Bdellovibrionales bacterium]
MESLNIPEPHNYLLKDKVIRKNERKAFWVTIVTFITMIVEISYGIYSGSMALLADGWHMASHAGALGVSYIVYRLAREPKVTKHFSFGSGKFIPLGGYTNGILLILVSMLMIYESTLRLINPVNILYDEAIFVTIIGLLVNIICFFILFDNGHKHEYYEEGHHHHHDHNIKGAIIHVLADVLTSVLAIIGLIVGKYWQIWWIDSLVGVVGGLLIFKWSIGLIRMTSWELLDGNAKQIKREDIVKALENNNTRVDDLHIWRIAPNVIACEVSIKAKTLKGSNYYKDILKKFNIKHLVIEEIS